MDSSIGDDVSDEEIIKITKTGSSYDEQESPMMSFFHDLEDTDSSVGHVEDETRIVEEDDVPPVVRKNFYGFAVAGDEEGMKQVLEENSDDYRKIINSRNPENGYTALMIAGEKGHLRIVRFLLTKGCNLNMQDNEGQTALMKSCENGNSVVAKLLLEESVRIDMRDCIGRTALILAAAQGETAVCRLFTRSTNIYVRNHAGRTVLIKSRPEVVDLSKASNIDIQDDNGWTALIWSIANGHTMVAKLLIASGASLDTRDKQGWNALIWAIVNNHKMLASLIISGGADVNIRDNERMTALMWVCRYGYVAVFDDIVASGCDITAVDEMGNSALHEACRLGTTTVSKHIRDDLIEKGANIAQTNHLGQMPTDVLPYDNDEDRQANEVEKTRLLAHSETVKRLWFVWYVFFVPKQKTSGNVNETSCGEVNCM